MKKFKISLFTGEMESNGQLSAYHLIAILMMAAFLLALAFIIKDGVLLAFVRKIGAVHRIKQIQDD